LAELAKKRGVEIAEVGESSTSAAKKKAVSLFYVNRIYSYLLIVS
jgi:hypothetical protein